MIVDNTINIIEEYEISEIENYYGSLNIFKTKENKYYWYIQDHSHNYAEEISNELYELIKKEKVQ